MVAHTLPETHDSAELPAGTVTFLYTDLEGSTRLLEQLRDQYAVLLTEHHDLMRSAFAKWHGSEMHNEGDSFFVAFPSAVDAVNCVVQLQWLLHEHRWPEGRQIRVRMGLHSGEPQIGRVGYIGMDLHRAARIGSAAHGGQVVLSHATRELVLHDLPAGVRLRDLGTHQLADISQPERIYQLEIPGLPCDFPPLRTLSAEEEPPAPGEPPYKGLLNYTEADAALFFGREKLTARLVEMVCNQRFLVIIGASGSGKSSLLRAGLLPALRKLGAAPTSGESGGAGARWYIEVITPTARPLRALATALGALGEAPKVTASAIDEMAANRCGLSRLAQTYLERARGATKPGPDAPRFLLVVDQFEELFTQCRDEHERRAFVENLLEACQAPDGPVSVIFTLRADFYDTLAQYPPLHQLVARQQEYIGAMDAAELRQAIERPAALGGWQFTPGLVDLILHDLGADEDRQPEPGALPLLSHALLETWRRRRRSVLSLRGYFESGGVRGAIARTAERVYGLELSPDEKVVARSIFVRLTELGEVAQNTRRRASLQEILSLNAKGGVAQVHAVLDKLADARLITVGQDSVEVAHEALIREWPTLREWLNEDREALKLHRHVTDSARAWQELGREPGELYRGARLQQAVEWAMAGGHADSLNALEREFLDASRAAAEREVREAEERHQRELEAARQLAESEGRRAQAEARGRQRARRLASGVAVIGLIALVLAAFAFQQSRVARTNEDKALQAQATAESDRSLALFAQSQAETERSSAVVARATAEGERAVAVAAEATSEARQVQVQAASARAEREAARANEQAQIALSRQLAAQSAALMSKDAPLALLLSVESLRRSATAADRNDLFLSLEVNPRWSAFMRASQESIYYSAFHDGERKLVTLGERGTVQVWDLEAHRLVSTFSINREPGKPFGQALSTDGALAAYSRVSDITIFDTMTGQAVGETFHGHKDRIVSLAIDNKNRVLSVDVTGVALRWNAFTHATEILPLPTELGEQRAITPDGSRIAMVLAEPVDGQMAVVVYDVAAQKVVTPPMVGHTVAASIHSVHLSADGRYLTTSSFDQTVEVWDVDKGVRPFPPLHGHTGRALAAFFNPDNRIIASGGTDNVLILWDATTGQMIGQPLTGHDNWLRAMDFTSDGRHLITADSGGTIIIWDLDAKRNLSGPQVRLRGAVFSPDDRVLLTGRADGAIARWDLKAGVMMTPTLPGPDAQILSLATSPDNTLVASAGTSTTPLWLWDAAALFRPGPLSGPVVGIPISDETHPLIWASFSPDGKELGTAGYDYFVDLVDVQGRKVISPTMTGHTSSVISAAFSPDGKVLATGSFDNSVILWDVKTHAMLFPPLTGHTGWTSQIAFTPDGKTLVSSSLDGTIRIWDATTGKPLGGPLTKLGTPLWGVAVVPGGNGRVVIATGGDGSLWRWDIETREVLGPPIIGGTETETVAFNADLSLAAIPAFDGQPVLLKIDKRPWAERACATANRNLTEAEWAQYLHDLPYEKTCPDLP